MYIMLLFWFVSNVFTAISAMDDTSKYPFHDIVDLISQGEDVEKAKKEVNRLCKLNKNPNDIFSSRTAATLSVEHCVNGSRFFENQLEILKLLLKIDEEKKLDDNKKGISGFLDRKYSGLITQLEGLRKRPFPTSSQIFGGGSFIVDDDDDDAVQRINDVLERISQVRELVGEPES